MHFSLVFLATIASTTVALPSSQYKWRAPGPGDRRSPCPMVNTLANHGYLPRNGLNVSLEQLVAGFNASINLAQDATELVGRKALTASTTGNNDTFNLDDINKHGIIEHDGSLSRNDVFFGDNHSFNCTIWDTVAAFFTEDTISINTSAKARSARLKAAAAVNPEFNMSASDVQFSLIESALYQSVFGTLLLGNAKTQWVKILFQEERLPFEEGFTRSDTPITSLGVLTMAGLIGAASLFT